MKRLAQIVSLGILLNLAANTPSLGAVETLIDEDFNDISDWTDLSTAITWGNNTEATSAFAINDGAVQLTPDAFNYTGYTAPNSLKTFTALDQQFLTPIDHASSIVTINFTARWNSILNSGSAENGRFIISLNYDYPEGGLDTTLDDKFDDFDQAWWARPAYHLRMRSGSPLNAQGTTLLQYGGGLTSAGEYESYDNPLTPETPDWWLPGFISGAGGVAPGTAGDYPNNSWVSTQKGVASTSFTNYQYVVTPDAQQFWVDANNNGTFEINELAATMPLPITNDNGAPLYQYFPTFEGIRLYWRGAGGESKGQVFLDNLTVTVESLISSSIGEADSSISEEEGYAFGTDEADSSISEEEGYASIADSLETSEAIEELTTVEMPPAIGSIDELAFSPRLSRVNRLSAPALLQATQSVDKSASVPEPSQTFALLGLAVLGLLPRYKQKRS